MEKSYTNCGGESSSRPFSKKSKLSISLERKTKVLHSLFLLCIQVEGYRNILKLTCSPLHFTLPEPYNFIKKETLTQVFSCEFCEICKNTIFTENLRTTAPVVKCFVLVITASCLVINTTFY